MFVTVVDVKLLLSIVSLLDGWMDDEMMTIMVVLFLWAFSFS